MANPNIELLTSIATAMGAVREQVVFVDAIVEVASLVRYHALAEQPMAQGFQQTMADNTPPFRWYWHGMQLDLVPLDEKVLGFANRWYKPGFEAATAATLPSGMVLRHLSAPYFMATKLEAFKDRGNNDVYLSHDLEDVITVVDGREELIGELTCAPTNVRDFVVQALRTGLVLQRFTQISDL